MSPSNRWCRVALIYWCTVGVLWGNTVRIEPVDAKQLNNKRVIW
jgi:hypothetical protein